MVIFNLEQLIKARQEIDELIEQSTENLVYQAKLILKEQGRDDLTRFHLADAALQLSEDTEMSYTFIRNHLECNISHKMEVGVLIS